MKQPISLVVVLAFLLAVTDLSGESKEWRGIVPLRSTRTDVERLLGAGANWCKCFYKLPDMNVFFQYSSGNCESGGSAGWNVPPETVLLINIFPKPNPWLSDLNLDMSRFVKQEDPHIVGNTIYADEDEGVVLEVDQGKVHGMYYGPSAKDKNQLRCPPKTKSLDALSGDT